MTEQQAECGAIPPNVSGPIACHLSSNHEGEHFSTSGCAGSEIRWLTAEHSSEEGGEGLSEAERDSARLQRDSWKASTERERTWVAEQQQRAESAEAERDDLRGRLAAVGSAVEQIESLAKAQATSCQAQHRADHARNWLDVLALTERAALANPSAAQESDHERMRRQQMPVGESWCDHYAPSGECDAEPPCPPLPSAAQGEGEVAECACDFIPCMCPVLGRP